MEPGFRCSVSHSTKGREGVSIPVGCSLSAKARPRLEHLACGGGGVSATGHVILGKIRRGAGRSACAGEARRGERRASKAKPGGECIFPHLRISHQPYYSIVPN
jgi:hypothetical protein